VLRTRYDRGFRTTSARKEHLQNAAWWTTKVVENRGDYLARSGPGTGVEK